MLDVTTGSLTSLDAGCYDGFIDIVGTEYQGSLTNNNNNDDDNDKDNDGDDDVDDENKKDNSSKHVCAYMEYQYRHTDINVRLISGMDDVISGQAHGKQYILKGTNSRGHQGWTVLV
jgi:predicted DNA binding CopG/RHH family protein